MEPQQVLHMLEQVASGSVSPIDAQRSLADQGYSDLGFAKVDTDRARRTGAGEVVYGAGKTADQIAGICLALRGAGQVCVLVTRLEAQKAEAVRAALLARDPQAAAAFEYRPVPQLGLLGAPAKPTRDSYIAVACAGTSDLYCAEEAAVTAEVLGSRVVRLYDVGVAGIHRLLAHRGDIAGASCVVAVAGMEGALASVVGGMVACPVIAVPTSVGYGASFGGVAALLAMLNSCASGVSVVNIDNGFGAGYQAHMIERAGSQHGEGEPDMKTLRWNLAENATRNQLLGDTLLQLPPDSRQRLEAAADAAGVPAPSTPSWPKPRLPRTAARSSKPTSMKSATAPASATRCSSAWRWKPRAPSASWPRSRKQGRAKWNALMGRFPSRLRQRRPSSPVASP